ncbi:hypothetical protein HLB44_11650 [Aquincola sp. S2]|uniref:RCC1-like domain-containing protein n=1 Tax=Pseudaquabacterium terrae TaxID=2732868 RepID=A0ABX2EG93_9BURK|nr:hypothetical protein [Aquabacterium terrae]NRF67639.1 hypothetical protein [Aquabacterium terrae]
MKLRTLFTLAIAAGAAAGCGGGSDHDQGPQQGRQRIARAVEALAAPAATSSQAAAAVDPALEATQLFNFAEANYPQLFPSHRPDMATENWRYRFYPETGIFLVVSDGRIFVLGGSFGEQVKYIGLAADVLNPPPNVVAKVVTPAVGKIGWNLAVTAQFTLTDTLGMAVPGPYTCSSDAPVAIEVASDCTAVTGRRLGTHTISVAKDGVVGKASVKVIPQAQPIGTGPFAKYNLLATPDGRALVWGAADAPLGQGTWTGSSIGAFLPMPVKAPTGDGLLSGVVAVAAGEYQAFALTEDGELYSWGRSTALGRPNTSGDSRAGKVTDPAGVQALKGIVAVSSGGANSLALADDGTVYAWGDATSLAGPDPKKLPGVVPGGKAVAIASGFSWNAALLADGRVVTWGKNTDGALGQGSTSTNELKPALVVDDGTNAPITGIVAISAGHQHGFALTATGRAYAWGKNTSGQLGHGDLGNRYTKAVLVSAPTGTGIWSGLRMVVAGGNHSLAIDNTGKAYSWGLGLSGELGDGAGSPRGNESALPAEVVSIAGTGQLVDVVSLGAGYGHSLALASDGRLLVWGTGFGGILGQGGSSTARSTVPLQVKNEVGTAPLNLGPVSYWPNLERRVLP